MKPSRMQRAWRVWLASPALVRVAAILFVAILFLLILPKKARAEDDRVAISGANSGRLTDHACTSEEVIKQLDPKFTEFLHQAAAVVDGKSFRGCWIAVRDAVFLIYEDGDRGRIPATLFKPERST